VDVRCALVSALAQPFFISSAWATSPTRLESVLPADTGVFLSVLDVSDFRARWPESPLGALWREPELGWASGGGDAPQHVLSRRIEEATGLDLVEILNAFEGQVAFVAPDLSAFFASGPTGSWAVAAVDSNDSALRALALRVRAAGSRGPAVEPTTRTASTGTVMHVLPAHAGAAEIGWAFGGGVAFLASPAAYLEALVAGSAATGSHLDESPALRELAPSAATSDLSLYVDLHGLRDLVLAGLAGMEKPDTATAAFLGITPEAVVHAFGLEAFRGFRVAASLSRSETLVDAGILVNDSPGLARLLAYVPGPCPRPAVIPPDVVFASVSRFRVAAFWAGLLEMLEAVQPGLSALSAIQIQAVARSAGVDFEHDLLEQLGDDTFTAYLPSSRAVSDTAFWGAFDQLSGIRVKNPGAMDSTVAALLAASPMPMQAPMETEAIGGVSVHTVRFGPLTNSPAFSYAFLDSMLLAAGGDPNVLAHALAAARGPGGSLWDRADLAPLWRSIPPEAANVTFWDPRALEPLARYPEPADKGDSADSTGSPARRARILAGIVGRHLGPAVASTVKTPSGFFTRMRLTHPEP